MPIRSQITRSSVRRSGTGGGGGGGGITSINGSVVAAQVIAPGTGIAVASAGGTTTITNTEPGSDASWIIGLTRIYAVDGVNGNDANAGFADPVTGSAASYRAASAAAGLVAKKTVAGLAAIFPRFGAGRTVEVQFAAGTYAGSPADFLKGASGYNTLPTVRGTGTVASAGAVAFSGSNADAIAVGGVTATGLNAAGYNPNGSISQSTIECVRAGGGAPGWGPEPALPLGLRIRFDVATTTAADRNVCRQVGQTAGTDTVLLQTAVPALPVTTDVFYTEQPGVVFTGTPNFDAAGTQGAQFVGIDFGAGTTFTATCGRFTFVFCTSGVFQYSGPDELVTVAQTYTHPVLGAFTPGGGLRGSTIFLSQGLFTLNGLVSSSQTLITGPHDTSTWGAGCAALDLVCVDWQGDQNLDTSQDPNAGIDQSFSVGIPHTFGSTTSGLSIDGCAMSIGQMNCIGAGATPGVQLLGKNSLILKGSIGGFTGNTDVGMDLQNSNGSQIQILATAAPTVTGTAGDVRWSGPAFGTWTQFQNQEQYDSAGNHIYQVVTNAEYDHAITPSVTLQVNNSGAPQNAYTLVAHQPAGASLQFTPAAAGSVVMGVLDHLTQNGEAAIIGSASGFRVVNFDATPTLGSLVYVSTVTPGLATITNPGNQVPLGVVVGNAFAGNLAIVHFGSSGAGTSSTTLGVANWLTGFTRVYAVDFVNGSDANKGFADPATVSAGDYALAAQAAGAVAKKTIAGLALILPRNGAGRKMEIIIANGGVNTAQNYTDALDVMLGGFVGWNQIDIRGTGTNVTAGCTAFDGSVADATYVGGITVVGLNVAGYNPVGATTTNLPMQLNGGGAAALPAEPAAPLGWRVRFDSATTTVALRNQCRQIAQVSGGNTIIPQTAFSAVPANADIFYIEQAGITVPASFVSVSPGGSGSSNSPTPTNLVGIRCTGLLLTENTELRYTFCGASSWTAGGLSVISVAQAYTHTVLGSLTAGGGLRCETSASITSAGGSITLAGLVTATTFQPAFINSMVWGAGCYAGTGLILANLTQATGNGVNTTPQVGITAALAQPRALGGPVIAASSLTIAGCAFTGAGAFPVITLRGRSLIVFSQGVCSGSTGNNDVGLDLTGSNNSQITAVAGAIPTFTGTLGDVRLANGQIVSWAQLAVTGVIDTNGNRIYFPSANPLGKLQFTGAIFGAAGATVSYCANAGFTNVVANEVIPFARPTSLRFIQRMRVNNLTNTSANAVTVTLYKNGAPTAMTVSIPAATVGGTQFSITTPIFFANTDTMDLRMDDGAVDAGGIVRISAALEYPL